MIVYNMKRSSGGSDKYGPCEICDKHVDTSYHLWSLRKYKKPDGTEGFTTMSSTEHLLIDVFGHYDCLSRMTEVPTDIKLTNGLSIT